MKANIQILKHYIYLIIKELLNNIVKHNVINRDEISTNLLNPTALKAMPHFFFIQKNVRLKSQFAL